MTVSDLYERSIKPLAAAERLHLAQMILNDIPPESLVDYSDSWSDEDLHDFAHTTWDRAKRAVGDDENASAG